jgi:NAD(P)H-hydrate epimerase
VFTKAQCREVDRLAMDEFSMPSLLLMENAARGVSSIILEGLQGANSPTVLLVCGPGNNGGDGLAIARHLHNRGVSVGVVLAADAARYSGDALVNMNICRAMGLPLVQAHADPAKAMEQMLGLLGDPQVIVDCLLGTGATAAAHGPIGALVELVNQQRTKGTSVISVDLPSGLDADTGAPCVDAATGAPGPCVNADLTVALAGIKAGFMNASAQAYVGELVVVDIGAPEMLLERIGTPMSAFAPAEPA